MKKLLFIILLCSAATAAGPIINPYRFGASAPLTYLLNQGFEGTGYDTGDGSNGGTWTEGGGTTPNEDYTTTPLAGSQSLNNSASGYTWAPFTGQTTAYIYFRIRFISLPASTSNESIIITNGGGSDLAALYVSSIGECTFWAGGGPSSSSATAIATATTYHCWMKFVSGGACELAMSTTSTKPTVDGSGNVYLTKTGASDTAAQFWAYNSSAASNYILDRVLVDDAVIGNAP